MSAVTPSCEALETRLKHLEREAALREKAEVSLRESEEKYRSVFENAAAATIIYRDDLTILMANAKALEISGYTESEMVGRMTLMDLVDKHDTERIRLYHAAGSESGVGGPWEYEFRLRDKQGGVREIFAKTARISGTTNLIGSFLDITERKKMERDRTRLDTVVEQSAESYIITNPHGEIQYVNPAFEKMSGYNRNEVLGKQVESVFAGQKDADVFGRMQFAVASGEVWAGRIANRRKDGTIYHTETTITPIRNRSGAIINFLNLKRDVTAEFHLENQLRQAQKLQAIGTLAGGIAHDFNNILAGIIGYTEMSLTEAPKDSQIPRKLKQVLQGCQRAKDLVRQILAFSRQNEQERKPVQIDLIVKEVLKLLKSTLPATIKVRKNIMTDASIILADPSKIHQILMNLCTNAFHAMKNDGGELCLTMADIEVGDASEPPYLDLKPGCYVKLEVSDTGQGMSADVKDRIFEPYFSTKAPGEGTGLGLSVVHGIVKSYEGTITVKSEKGKGSTFSVYLPSIECRTEPLMPPAKSIPGGRETILLVDDDPFVLEMTAERLKGLGYAVVSSPGAKHALALFSSSPDVFDLVITDQTMPDMTGIELAKRAMALRRTIPVILCTGFSTSIDRDSALEQGVKEFVLKPIVLMELAMRIRSVLDDAGAGRE